MTDTPLEVLVFADQEGSFYLFTRDLLDSVRVPAEQAVEVTRLIEDADTSGFAAGGFLPTLTPVTSLLTMRKAGKEQHEYLIVTLNEAFISSVRSEGQPGQG